MALSEAWKVVTWLQRLVEVLNVRKGANLIHQDKQRRIGWAEGRGAQKSFDEKSYTF